MTYEDIRKASETIKTTDIRGKQYAEVNQRIKAFRMLCPHGTIATEIVSHENNGPGCGIIIMKASVLDEEGRLLGTGTAYEKEGSSNINKTSYIENCETSCVGRALAMCGLGIDLSVASYEEVENAIEQQEAFPPREKLIEIARNKYPDGTEFQQKLLQAFDNAPSIEALTDYQLRAIYSDIESKKKRKK